MARIISVLALAAVAAAELPRIKNKDGNLVLSVGDGGGKVGVSCHAHTCNMNLAHWRGRGAKRLVWRQGFSLNQLPCVGVCVRVCSLRNGL